MGQPGGDKQVGGERRLAEGVYARGRTLRLTFPFRGVNCRERLSLEPTPPNVRYAVRLRGEIMNAIGMKTFNYADYFPESANARRFGFVGSAVTIGTLLDDYAAMASKSLSASTWQGYKKRIDGYLRPWFGNVRVRDLTTAEIRARLLAVETRDGKALTLKSARNIITPLANVIELAIIDRHRDDNPLDRLMLKRLWPADRVRSGWAADPFAFEEMTVIFDKGCASDEEADYWRFAFGTGMRTSELIALNWGDVDARKARVRVERAIVGGVKGERAEKGPKTLAGRRDIDLTVGAWEALQRQRARTQLAGGMVWRDWRTGARWGSEHVLRMRWSRICVKAGVRYRNPYQTRHTFASVLLGAGVPPLRVAKWMGHVGTEMLNRTYGKWIEQGASDPQGLAAFFALAAVAPALQREA